MKKFIITLFSIGTLFIILSTISFSYLIPKKDSKIANIESELDELLFSMDVLNNEQIWAQINFNLGKILDIFGSLATKQKTEVISGIIDIIKDSMISAHLLKYGERIDEQKINELYPTSNIPTRTEMDEFHAKFNNLIEELTFYEQKKIDLKEQKSKKSKLLGWSIFFQIVGLSLIGIVDMISRFRGQGTKGCGGGDLLVSIFYLC